MSIASLEKMGKRIAPPRFLAFALITIAAAATLVYVLRDWRAGTMAGFDIGAFIFLISCWPLLDDSTAEMRRDAARNDANRAGLLAITAAVTLVILVAVASELSQKNAPKPVMLGLVIVTLMLAWCFSNMIYALHYAHIFYVRDKGQDRGGIEFPGTKEPNYWDFVYFAFCLGMTFQTSDTNIKTTSLRRTATFHCLAAFVFNLGVLAFTINVLGGS
jgi:uncharacterized membrane protein